MFYLWKRIFEKLWIRRLLCPFYAYSVIFVVENFKRWRGFLWVLIFFVALSLTLLPVPLLEPRYFTPAVVIAILNIPPDVQLNQFLWLQVAGFLVVNFLTVWIFLHWTFIASDGSIGRFIY